VSRATLAVWDGEEVHDLEVRWTRGYDVDAKIRIPRKLAATWREATRLIKRDHQDGDPVQPYPTLEVGVPASKLGSTATGFYAVATEAWGRSAAWRVAPPYPAGEDPGEEVTP